MTVLTQIQRRSIIAAVSIAAAAALAFGTIDMQLSVRRLELEQQRITAELSALTADDVSTADIPEPGQAVTASAAALDSGNGDGGGEPGAPGSIPRLRLSAAGAGTEIDRAYGYDYNPNTEDYRFHRGCDSGCATGTQIMAVADGTVTEAAEDPYWGGVIRVDHGGGWAVIYRCVTPAVEVGNAVRAGDALGTVVSAPAEAVQPSHLHLELEHDGASCNPALYW